MDETYNRILGIDTQDEGIAAPVGREGGSRAAQGGETKVQPTAQNTNTVEEDGTDAAAQKTAVEAQKAPEAAQPQTGGVPTAVQEPSQKPLAEKPSAPKAPATAEELGDMLARGESPKLRPTQIVQIMNAGTLQTKEEQERERKRQKRDKMLAAIGDGISALSNLYFTSRYAPNAFDPSTSMSARAKARWDRIKAEREANRRAYVNDYMRAAQTEAEDEYRQGELKHRAEREAAADKAAADAVQREKERDDWERKFKTKAADDKKAADDREYELKKAKAEEDRRHNRKMEGIASVRASRTGSGGGSSKGGKPYGTFLGKTYKTKADYDRAVVAYARSNGIPLTYGKESTDEYGMKSKTQTNRTIAGLAAEAEAHYRRSHAAKPKFKTATREKPRTGNNGGWASGLKL